MDLSEFLYLKSMCQKCKELFMVHVKDLDRNYCDKCTLFIE